MYGQTAAGVRWYGATSALASADAGGNSFAAPEYEATAHLYENFGTAQGWTPSHTFDVVFASTYDTFASILGFGDARIIVGRHAFDPGETAADAYVLPLAVGNSNGWDAMFDVRTFVDSEGNPIDLNSDGITDFVGMGPSGLVYAYGSLSGNDVYALGELQTAHVNGTATSFGRAQGWADNTLREIVRDPTTGYYDIFAFNTEGLVLSIGQDPAAHGGEPFGQQYLALRDLAEAQGWTSAMPRLVADVSGDEVLDIIAFGESATYTVLGAWGNTGNSGHPDDLHMTMDWSRAVADLATSQGWDDTTFRGLADVDGSGHSSLVHSGAYYTQIWDLA